MARQQPTASEAAVRTLALLSAAEAAFPYGDEIFLRALNDARRAMGRWAIGLVADLVRKDTQ